MRRAPPVQLPAEERRRLTALLEDDATSPRVAARARIILRAATGAENREIAKELGTDPGTVALWRRRFLSQRIPGIERDAPRSGRPPRIPSSTIQVIVRSTLGRRPRDAPFWSARTLAREVGVSKSTVQRVWKSHHLEPRRPSESFRESRGSEFVENVTDFVGLYLNPPERAMAFSVEENARGSALGRAERKAIADFEESRPALEFRAFLQQVDRETPKSFDVHLVLDSRLAPTSPEVRRWLVRHPRFYLHFLPSDRSQPNLIDRWFASFLRKRVDRSTLPSVARLHRAIQEHYARPGAAHRPFLWTATADEIRDRSGRARSSRARGVAGSR